MGMFRSLFGRRDARAKEPVAEPEQSDWVEVIVPEIERAEAAGSFRGKHFTEWAPIVTSLRAEGRLDESLALAFECIEATERQDAIDGYGPAPAYYEAAAMVLRKQERYAEEVEVLERYMSQTKHRRPKFEDRRAKAAALRDAERDASPLSCPACGTVLEDPPKSRGKCTSCGQPLVVRTVAKQKRVFTPEQSEAHTIADKAARQRAKYVLRIGNFGLDAKDWERVHADQARRFGHQSADADVYWQLANEAAVGFEQRRDWLRALRVRSDMAKHLVQEGRDWVHVGRQAQRNAIRALQQYDRDDAEMILLACGCEACRGDHLMKRTLGQFARSDVLPHAECAVPPCTCNITRRMY